ncbi:MAG: hypothetical protein EOP84_09210, partial [Verrucomicrobiaceae bacterium]
MLHNHSSNSYRTPIILKGAIAALTLSALAPDCLQAAPVNWDGGAADANWQTSANWLEDVAPLPNDILVFSGVARLNPVNDFTTGTQFDGIDFDALAGPFTLTGNGITLNGNIRSASTNLQRINLDLDLNANREVDTVAGGTVEIGGAISGTSFGLTKTGAGTLVLSGFNSYTGATTITSGTLNYTGSGTSGMLLAGGETGRGVLSINTAGALVFRGDGAGFNSVGGKAGVNSTTGAGAVIQTDGSVTVGSSAGYLEMGTDIGTGADKSTYGSYTLAGGTLTTSGSPGNGSGIRIGAGGFGVFTQTGGVLNMNRFFVVGSGGGVPNTGGGTGVATFTGGTMTIFTEGGNQRGIIVGDTGNSTGVMNVGTLAGGDVLITSSDTNGVRIGNNATSNATLNLNSGTLSLRAGSIRKPNGGATGVVNLNGATIQAGVNNQTLIDTSLTSVNVYRGGAVFDTQNFNTTVSANLLGTAGNGIYRGTGIINLSEGIGSGGSDYIGAPLVTITSSNPNAAGAMAIANVSGGVITGVTLTNPGQNYQVGDTLTFTFSSGGAIAAAEPFQYTLTAADLAANTSGGLIKKGTGILALTGTNSYSGVTAIQEGTVRFAKQASLYNSDPAKWTASNIVVQAGATLALNVGGTGEFTASDVAFFAGLGTATGGLTNGANLGIDTTNAVGNFTYTSPIVDGNGGSNSLGLTKLGAGTLVLTGSNTYTGSTTIGAGGTLQIGDGGTTGTFGAGPVITNGTLTINRSDALTYA